MAVSKADYGLLRLKSKTAREAIVQKLSSDFNLTPVIAEAYYRQIVEGHDHSPVRATSIPHPRVTSVPQ